MAGYQIGQKDEVGSSPTNGQHERLRSYLDSSFDLLSDRCRCAYPHAADRPDRLPLAEQIKPPFFEQTEPPTHGAKVSRYTPEEVESYPLLPPRTDLSNTLLPARNSQEDIRRPVRDVDYEELRRRVYEHARARSDKMQLFDNLKGWDKFKVYRYILLLCLSLSGDGWTYESSVIASIIQLPAWIAHLGYDTEIPDNINQWIGPVYSLGQLTGGLVAAYFLDTFGRKITLTIGALLMELSTALLVWSPNVGVVIAARIIEGESIGFLLLGYQIYAVEIAAKEDRGFVSSFSLMTGNFFGLLAAGIIYGISYSSSNTGWRCALGITFIPATILLLVLPWVPESPRYLYEKGKDQECRKVVGRLHGYHTDENGTIVLSEVAEREYDAMRAAISWDQEHGQDKWAALWNSKAARYRSFVAFSSQSWWAWNGGSIFTYYYTIVFSAAGITDPHVQFGISGVQNASWCVGGIVGGYLLDFWGRRTNYLIGTGQACICLIIQGGLVLGIFDKGIVNHAAGAGFVTVYIIQWFLWVTFFSPVVNMLPAEIYSAGLRARGYAIANIFSMGVGFATQYSALPMYRHMHGWVWIFFSACMAFAFTVIYFTYPETKGLTLEEVEIVFGTGAGQRVKQALGKASPIDPRTPIHFKAEDDLDEADKGAVAGSSPVQPVSSSEL